MKLILAFSSLMLSLTALAELAKVRIEKIDRGLNSNEPDLLYFSDGRVGLLPLRPEKTFLTADNLQEGSVVEVELDEKHNVLTLEKMLDATLETEEGDVESVETNELTSHYRPTILPNYAAVSSIFRKMNRGWQRKSQCYNRAHVWNYEEFQRSGVKSKKVFIFYTHRYIRDYNFYWWFHAIPTVLVNHEGSIHEWYLDPMFARTPLARKDWTDLFIRSKRHCPVITKYSTYENNQESEHCYLHFSSMYYWQPRDLDRYERTGFEKNSFIRSEVNHAYWEAF